MGEVEEVGNTYGSTYLGRKYIREVDLEIFTRKILLCKRSPYEINNNEKMLKRIILKNNRKRYGLNFLEFYQALFNKYKQLFAKRYTSHWK